MIRYTCNYPSDDIHFQLKLNLERSQDTVLEQLTETLHTKLRVLSHSVDWQTYTVRTGPNISYQKRRNRYVHSCFGNILLASSCSWGLQFQIWLAPHNTQHYTDSKMCKDWPLNNSIFILQQKHFAQTHTILPINNVPSSYQRHIRV